MNMHSPLPPFAATSGSKHPKIVLLGEAWGGNEVEFKRPFVGEAGKELWRMLGEAMPGVEPELHAEITSLHRYAGAWIGRREAWLEAAGIAMTNVLAFRPPNNKLEELTGAKAEVGGNDYVFPAIAKGKYLCPEYLPELDRLFTELAEWRPNLIVALGNTASWAVLQATNIGSIRGAIAPARTGDVRVDGMKVLPTYHPAGVLRQWSWRPIVVADLIKASLEAEFPEIRRPERSILVNPTLEEVFDATDRLCGAIINSVDIETEFQQIKTIGFSNSKDWAISIPFIDKSKPGWNYWDTPAIEHQVWNQVDQILQSPGIKLFQNGLYDLQYILRMGLTPRNCTADTMLLHHSLFPEMQKGLGFLGSIYTNEIAWKLLRHHKTDTEKRDE